MADAAGASSSAAGAQEDKPAEVHVSVMDSEAWERKHLPQLGYDVLDTAIFRWSLKEFSWERLEKRRQKLYSDVFECGGHKWKLMLFLGGVLANDPGKVSIYLVCASTAKEDHPCAQMGFAMSNPNDPTVYLTYNSYHRFTPHDDDWGFTYFCNSDRLREPISSGRATPLLADDHVIISVFVRVVRDPTGVLWYNLGAGYCPRATTGLMNIFSNHGAASLGLALQLLYSVAPFRKELYSRKAESGSLTHTMQRLFYELQTSQNGVAVDSLVSILGWSDARVARSRHDLMEYIRALLELLDEADDSSSKSFSSLFTGELVTTHRTQTIRTAFDALTLDVRGFSDLSSSLRDCIMEEGELQVRADSLPPVVFLNLRRWRWDASARALTKCDERLEYPTSLDLSTYGGVRYALHALVSHDGTHEGGQYALYARPASARFWVKFDATTVVPVVLPDLADSATALVYVREDMKDEVGTAPSEDEVPKAIKDLKTEWASVADETLTVKVATRKSFKAHPGQDLAATFEVVCRPDEKLREVLPRLPKGRLRAMVRRHNRAVRPGAVVPTSTNGDLTMKEVGARFGNAIDGAVMFFVEDPWENKAMHDGQILLFLKYCDIAAQTLRGVGAVYVEPGDKLSTLRGHISRAMKWGTVELDVVEEVMHGVVGELPLDGPATFRQCNIQTGDIVVFSRKGAAPKKNAVAKNAAAHKTVKEFYAALPRA